MQIRERWITLALDKKAPVAIAGVVALAVNVFPIIVKAVGCLFEDVIVLERDVLFTTIAVNYFDSVLYFLSHGSFKKQSAIAIGAVSALARSSE